MNKHLVIIGGSSPIGEDLIKKALNKEFFVTCIGRKKLKIKSKNLNFIKIDLNKKNDFKKIFLKINKIRISHFAFLQRVRSKNHTLDKEINVSINPIISLINEFLFYNLKNKNKSPKSIILTSSPVVGKSTIEQNINYHLGKAMIEQIVKYYSIYLGKINCNINALSPDLIIKERSKAFYKKNKNLYFHLKKITPLNRMATPEEISKIIIRILNYEFNYFNGQIFHLDGGISSHNSVSISKISKYSIDYIKSIKDK